MSNANTLEVKAKLLGLDKAKKAEVLTKLYKGKISFMLDKESNLIYIDKVDSSINVLELPELPCFDFKFLIRQPIGVNVCTLKFPKCMPPTDLSHILLSPKIKRVFAWDNNLYNSDGYMRNNNLDMVVMQFSNGAKPKIYQI